MPGSGKQCKVIGFVSDRKGTEEHRLRDDLAQAALLLGKEGISCSGTRGQAFTLAPFDGVELVRLRHDLLPGPTPAGAIVAHFTIESGAFDPGTVAAAAAKVGWQHPCVVDEHITYTSHQWGKRPSTIVRVGLISKLPGMTRQEFAEHWILRHAPLAVEHGPLYDLYVCNVVVYPETGWDGVVEHWFTDIATWREHDRRNIEEKPSVIASARSGSEMQQFAATPVAVVDAGVGD